MTETRVKDVFPISKGIMSVISEAGGYSFNDDMDLRLLANCGRRCITPVIEMILDGAAGFSDELLQRLASLILAEYKDSWDRVFTTLTMEYNPLSASQYTETENIASEGENSDINKEVKQDDVSTSDILPDNFISDGKSTSDTTASGKTKNNTTRTLTRTSNSTSYKPVDLINSEIDMRIKNRFVARILDDVKNYIAMPIY